MDVAAIAMKGVRRRRIIQTQPCPISPVAQRIHDEVNELKISNPERYKEIMEAFKPKPAEPVKFDPDLVKTCRAVMFERFGPAKLNFIPATVADLSEAACANEFESYSYTQMANSSPNRLLWTIINPATREPDQAFKDMIILRYRHKEEEEEESSETLVAPSTSYGVSHGLLGSSSSSSSSVLKRHREDSTETETLVAPAGSAILKRHREDLGDSVEPMVDDSSAPTSDGNVEYLGKSSESEKPASASGDN